MQILLVEDDQETRVCLAEFLRDHGHSVIEMQSASEAMNSKKYEDIDLIISDVRMDGISGIEFLEKTRENSSVSFILMSAYEDCMDSMTRVKALCADCLLKPIDLDHFAELVEKAAENSRTSLKESH